MSPLQLKAWHDPLAIEPLVDLLQHGSRSARNYAAWLLEQFGDLRGVNALINALNRINAEKKSAEKNVSREWLWESDISMWDYTKRFRDVRDDIVHDLACVKTTQGIQCLVAALQNNPFGLKDALTKIGEPAVPLLVAALQDPNATLRHNVLDVLAELVDDTRAVEALQAAVLQDEDEKVRNHAKYLLENKGLTPK